jgi:undecaprenyl-diphosphatase
VIRVHPLVSAYGRHTWRVAILILSSAGIGLVVIDDARADEPPPSPPTAPTAPAKAEEQVVQPSSDPARKTDVEPKAAEPATPGRTTFDVDPITDGAIIGVSLGFAGILGLINSTGEVRPQQISPTFDRSHLLEIDRGALSQNVDDNAGTYSNIGLGVAAGYAVLDPILSGLREKSVQTGLVDGVMYAESVSLTFAMTSLVKMAVRRPRPTAYIEAEAHKGDPTYSNTDTDSSLSFFSGHASTTAALGATATYLAFARSPHTLRPWITLVLATALCTFVSVERVRAGAHFPTDVIAGSIAGAGVGVLVPHLHRSEDIKKRRMWVGFAPEGRGEGGLAMLSGLF